MSLNNFQFGAQVNRGQRDPTPISRTAARNKDKQLFKDTPTPIEDLTEMEVIIPKNARDKMGSTDYHKNMSIATYSLEDEFGVAMCHIDTRSDVKDGD